MDLTCEWQDCHASFKERNSLFRHMFRHWPWQVHPVLCHYCKRGFYARYALEAHIDTEAHQLQVQYARQSGEQAYDVDSFVSYWLATSLSNQTITQDHMQRLKDLHRITSDTIEHTPTTHPNAEYEPVSPQPLPMAPTPVMDDDPNPIPDLSDLTKVNATTSTAMTSSSGNVADANATGLLMLMPPHPNPVAAQSNGIVSVSSAPTPLLPITESDIPSTSYNITSQTHVTSMAPSLPPILQTPQVSTSPPKNRRSTQSHLPSPKRHRPSFSSIESHVQSAPTPLEQNIILARAMDNIIDRLEGLELNLQRQTEQIAKEQSDDIIRRSRTLICDELHTSKEYTKELMQVLLDNISKK